MVDLQRARKERVLRNNRGVIEFHKRKERAEREKKERLQREKIQALKENDVEGYMKLVKDAKSDRFVPESRPTLTGFGDAGPFYVERYDAHVHGFGRHLTNVLSAI